MTKKDFLDELKNGLLGEVDAAVCQENINYYSTYIDQQMATGKSEQEVVDGLGSGYVVAKTITQANKQDYEYQQTSNNNYSEHMETAQEKQPVKEKVKNIGTIILIGAIVLAILCVVLKVVTLLLPIILVLVLVGFVLKKLN